MNVEKTNRNDRYKGQIHMNGTNYRCRRKIETHQNNCPHVFETYSIFTKNKHRFVVENVDGLVFIFQGGTGKGRNPFWKQDKWRYLQAGGSGRGPCVSPAWAPANTTEHADPWIPGSNRDPGTQGSLEPVISNLRNFWNLGNLRNFSCRFWDHAAKTFEYYSRLPPATRISSFPPLPNMSRVCFSDFSTRYRQRK